MQKGTILPDIIAKVMRPCITVPDPRDSNDVGASRAKPLYIVACAMLRSAHTLQSSTWDLDKGSSAEENATGASNDTR